MAPPSSSGGQQTLSNMWKKASSQPAKTSTKPSQPVSHPPPDRNGKKSGSVGGAANRNDAGGGGEGSNSNDSLTPPPSEGRRSVSTARSSSQNSPTPAGRSSAPLQASAAKNGAYRSKDRPASVLEPSASPSPSKELTPPQSSPMDVLTTSKTGRDGVEGGTQSRRRSATKRTVNYVESDEEGMQVDDEDDDDDSDRFSPEPETPRPSKRAKSGGKKSRAELDSDDEFGDFIIPDDDLMDAVDEEEASPVKRPKAKPKAANEAQSSKMALYSASAPRAADVQPRRPVRPALDRGSSSKQSSSNNSKEQPYDFLLPENVCDAEGNRPNDPNYDRRTLYIPNRAWKDFTPFERQFWEIKKDHYDQVIFFQKGKFYELYEDDALIGHQQFGLKITDRVKMKMAGVPEASFDMFANKFLALGYKVGRVDQLETATGKDMRTKGKGGKAADIVVRELVQVMTAGTITDANNLSDDMATYCVAIKERLADEAFEGEDGITGGGDGESMSARPTFGVCVVDAATAQFSMLHFQDDVSRAGLETLIRSLRIKELLHEKAGLSKRTLRMLRNSLPSSCQITLLKPDTEFLDAQTTLRKLNTLFNPDLARLSPAPSLDEVDEADPQLLPGAIASMLDKEEAISALGGLLFYLGQLQLDRDLSASRNFALLTNPLQLRDSMIMDAQTLGHLNVFQNEQGDSQGTLLELLNRAVTPFGKRLFKMWLRSPLNDVATIRARQEAVDDFLGDSSFRESFDELARKLPDIERITSRINANKCRPKDFTKVLDSLSVLDGKIQVLADLASDFRSTVINDVLGTIPLVSEKARSLQSMFDQAADGSFLPRQGKDDDYEEANDHLISTEGELNDALAEAARQVSLKPSQVKFKHIGTNEIYQIEVPAKTKVPNDWNLMSQAQGVRRFYPPTIRQLVKQLKEARETRLAAIKAFNQKLFGQYQKVADVFLAAAAGIADVDCLLSLAKASQAMGEPTCRPEIIDDDREAAIVDFEGLRHPCMAVATSAEFIANDVSLGCEKDEELSRIKASAPRVTILTGGNMAGKSTMARTTATGVILAQMGCRVPATKARLSPIDRIATRMGANDQIFQNNSTFMVEMLEAAKIIKECTPRSLVIMDELGRGTSTFDGQAIAYAVLHHLVMRMRCLGFFLTHYTSLAHDFEGHVGVINKHMQVIVDDQRKEVIFTYRLVKGIAESSYGTQVAALAGVPMIVCDRAQTISEEFAEATKKNQAERCKTQTNLPMTLLSDFAFLWKVGAEEIHVDEDGKVEAQLDVVQEQVDRILGRAETDESMRDEDDEMKSPASSTPTAMTPRKTISYGGRSARRLQGQRGEDQSREEHPLASTKDDSDDDDEGTEALHSSASPAAAERGAEQAAMTKSSGRKAEQMILDLGQKIRVTCKGCGMSYDRSDAEDVSLHKRMHDELVLGIEWNAKLERMDDVEEVGKPVKLTQKVRDVVRRLQGGTKSTSATAEDGHVRFLLCRRKQRQEQGRNGSAATATLEKKLVEIEKRTDESLGAVTKASGTNRNMILAIWQSKRVVGAAVVGDIKPGKTRRLLASNDDHRTASSIAPLNSSSSSPSLASTRAMFVSEPISEDKTPPLAIHRISVLPPYRSTGLGTALLDAALETAVYGLSAADLEASCGGRAYTTCFSQPTELGQKLARSWIQRGAHGKANDAPLLVFDEDDED